MRELYSKKAECCGCEACGNICPRGAISMQEDPEGFLYPFIDSEKCKDCGLCEKVCPEKNKSVVDGFHEHCFAGYSNSTDEVRTSASGGLASALTYAIIERGGTSMVLNIPIRLMKCCLQE